MIIHVSLAFCLIATVQSEFLQDVHNTRNELDRLDKVSKLFATLPKQFLPTWESLDVRELPSWYDKAKIGIFIHWGVYSVPSFGSEWFWNFWRRETTPSTYTNFMEKNHKPNFTYRDFAREFTAEFYDPKEWVKLFEASGAKYVVLTSKHHEGYALWPSKYSYSWNSIDVGPHRDLVGELAEAVRNNPKIHFGLHLSLFEWYNPIFLADQKTRSETDEFVRNKVFPEMLEINYDDQCNKKAHGLWNGNMALSGDFKYQVFLTSSVYNPCSGVIIDEWHILTVAHCVWAVCPDQITVYAGTSSFVDGVAIKHEVQNVHIHDDYNPHSGSRTTDNQALYHLGNDIAMLTLENPLLLGIHVEKVRLPDHDISPCPPFTCYITGWSTPYQNEIHRPGHLLWVRTLVLQRLHCLLRDIHIRENEFCAEDLHHEARVYPLDNGGGMVCDGVLVGMIVTSNPNDHRPIVYANIYDFKDFINGVIKKDKYLYYPF